MCHKRIRFFISSYLAGSGAFCVQSNWLAIHVGTTMQWGQFQIIFWGSPCFEGLQFRAHSLSSYMESIWRDKSAYLRLTNEITYWTNAEVTMSTSIVLLNDVMRFIVQHQPICNRNLNNHKASALPVNTRIVSCPAHMCLPVRTGLVNRVKFLGLITQME